MTEPTTTGPRGASASASAAVIILILLALAALVVLSGTALYVVVGVCVVGLIACIAMIARSGSGTAGPTSGNSQ